MASPSDRCLALVSAMERDEAEPKGSVDITAGTGRFTNTTGNFTTDGTFVAWNPESSSRSPRNGYWRGFKPHNC